MAKCSNCGKKGFLLKLENGLCNDCASLAHRQNDLVAFAARRDELQSQLDILTAQLADQQAVYDKIVAKAEADGSELAIKKIQTEREAADAVLAQIQQQCDEALAKLQSTLKDEEKARRNVQSLFKKIDKSRDMIRAIDHAVSRMNSYHTLEEMESVTELSQDIDDYISPTVTLDLQCLSMRALRKKYKENEKHIAETLDKYKGRYTTKTNIAIYKLMVIALSAELQNVLYSIKYGKLEDALSNISAITNKYYTIAADGNQNIAGTLKKFIGEIDFYFQEAVRIEYEYYVQKERAKEEQRAIREQMRQEAEERRALEAEKKKIEKEESKFQGQIAQIEEQLSSAEPDKVAQLEARLAELQSQLSAVKEKKDVIATLQNGKAGNVYVISNLGSFGDDVFKIGMTRRADPQDRIDELGDASVPFPFDVHSFIFSDDAAALEHRIHEILNDRRINKVNLRKEFFNISLDELESLVGQLAPTAEFKRTMLAEQYRQSLSIGKVVTASADEDLEEEEE